MTKGLELDGSRRPSLQDIVMGGAWLACTKGDDGFCDRGQEVATEAVLAAVAAGILDIDTAPLYGHGLRESRLGAALSALPAASAARLRIITKAGRLLTDNDDGVLNDFTADGADRSLSSSLSRLGLSKVHGLRIHDPNDSPERPPEIDEVGVALGPGGMLERLLQMRSAGTIERVSLGMNSNVVRSATPHTGRPLPPSMTHGVPAEIVRLVRDAPSGAFDEALLAGGWSLLDQSGLEAMLACQGHGIAVAVAGIYATGLLVGGTTFAYQEADAAKVAAVESWRALAAEYGVSLPALAIAFAFVPVVVSKVVLGMATAEEVAKNVAAVEESRRVPADVWREAAARGLLPAHILKGMY